MLSGGVMQPGADDRRLVPDGLRDGVRLLRVAEEELRRQVLEPELVRDVRLAVAVLVDVDVVPGGRAERVVVRARRGILTGDPVGDDRCGVRLVGRHERVEVRVVGCRILRDERRLSVTRRRGRRRPAAAHNHGQRETRHGSRQEDASCKLLHVFSPSSRRAAPIAVARHSREHEGRFGPSGKVRLRSGRRRIVRGGRKVAARSFTYDSGMQLAAAWRV